MIQASIVMGALGVSIWVIALSMCAYGALIRAHRRKS
jgi:hypothetical protein